MGNDDERPGIVPSSEITRRISSLQRSLRDEGIDAALVLEAADLYYLTGTVQDAHLVVPAEGPAVLHVRRSFERACEESPLERIEPLRSLRELSRALTVAGIEGRLGLELDVLPASRFLAYRELLSTLELVDCSRILRRLRARKSPWELERIERAAAMLDEAFTAAWSLLCAGPTELDLQAELERLLRRSGHDGFVRARGFNQEIHYGLVLSGKSAAVVGGTDAAVVGPGSSPAVGKGASHKRIGRNEPVLIDLVGAWQGYLADESRTLAIGELPDVLIERLVRARAVLAAVAEGARPGVPASQLYAQAVELGGDLDGFMGVEPVSFVGHGLGLEIGEPPFLARGHDDPLEEGNVFALEPKFVLRGLGAVGVEDTYVVESGGARRLTHAPDPLHA
jgi:Xaa-Pro aminopeptidase